MSMRLKYGNIRVFSELCGRNFSSKLEARRGEELALLERAGEITDLQYQVRFVLNEKPRVTLSVDFAYKENGKMVYEDSKGIETREFRVKRIWLRQLTGIDILLTR